MEQQHQDTSGAGLSGVIPMVRIDGARVRRLREGKGLTQLYLSTVVGVTTDTISRWENRHYQSVKLENAEKLAGALEVGLAEILEQPQAGQAATPGREADAPEERPRPDRQQGKWLGLAVAAFAFVVIGLLLYALFPRQQSGALTAERILPPQAPPGQSFPVLIRVRAAGPEPMSLLLKETLPAGSRSPQAVPETTTTDPKDNSLKWIGRSEPGESLYAYLCQVGADAASGATLSFSGTVTRKQALGVQEAVAGEATVTVAPFHWADTNRDQVIDDEEILVVYDLYSEIKGLDFDRDRIDAIWAAGGYRWDERKKKYVLPEQDRERVREETR